MLLQTRRNILQDHLKCHSWFGLEIPVVWCSLWRHELPIAIPYGSLYSVTIASFALVPRFVPHCLLWMLLCHSPLSSMLVDQGLEGDVMGVAQGAFQNLLCSAIWCRSRHI